MIDQLPAPERPVTRIEPNYDCRPMLQEPEIVEMLRVKQREEPNSVTRYWLDLVDNRPILRVNSEMIARAKCYPIINLVKPRMGFIKCPFHGEDTASCKVYANNSFHCFGCQKHGDVIDLYRQLNNATFQEAVVYLST